MTTADQEKELASLTAELEVLERQGEALARTEAGSASFPAGAIGDHVVAYLDYIGRVEGRIVRLGPSIHHARSRGAHRGLPSGTCPEAKSTLMIEISVKKVRRKSARGTSIATDWSASGWMVWRKSTPAPNLNLIYVAGFTRADRPSSRKRAFR